ncbi:sensor histidine kinase [Streptomyces meridianus]|uniref:histidine kinase n=1 Tax=Streptomyces meridianus TaxID=2938945 RepID=A0ABT0XD83_9ACTN|nr:sensor histidine kinase [Streptomyces meridianus]MCM2580355.1 sensor histidine kinase [Streptomyces meridianus]
MQRLYEFLRRHPTGVDTFWAVVTAGFAGLWIFSGELEPGRRIAAIPVTLALGTVIALRRRLPERMLLLAAAVGVAQLVLDIGTNPADFALLVIVFTVGAIGARWASRVALAGGLCAPTIAALRWPPENGNGWTWVVYTAFMTVPFALAWVLGDSLRTRRAYYAQLEERAARLEREREAQSKVAVAAERARIARELHDVVAHNVSAMVVQADGAAFVLDTAPDRTRQALGTISQTGRQALAEMRRLLGVLRSGEPPGTDTYLPQPGVGQLEELIARVREAGLPVRFAVEGSSRPLPSGVELTAYRIVQEALTNTRKHAGPQAGARVRLTYRRTALDLLVEDDGRGDSAAPPAAGGADGLGQGLIGMRERVGMVGGRLTAGPRPGGGFRVAAVLPLGAASQETGPRDARPPVGHRNDDGRSGCRSV